MWVARLAAEPEFGPADEERGVTEVMLFRKGKLRRHGTILLNWHGDPPREFRFYAQAFHQLGRRATRALKRRRHFPVGGLDDFEACPIVFLYRHSLELYLKAILIAAGPLYSPRERRALEKRLCDTHRLDPLIVELRHLFEIKEWPWAPSLEDLRRIGAEFDKVDPTSFAFRYPTNKSLRASLPPRFQFDLFDLCAALDELLPELGGWASVLDERVDERRGDARP